MDFPVRTMMLLMPLLAAFGCSERAVTGDPDGADADTSGVDPETGESGTDTSDTPSDLPEPDPDPGPEPFDCAAACADPVDGSCLLADACVDYCASRSARWPAEVREAFAGCVETDPMCFVSTEHCLLSALHREGTVVPVTLTGVGFDDYEGRTVEVWHDPQALPSFAGTTTIAGGAFELAWIEPVPLYADWGPLLLLYVDLDDDQACTLADLATMVNLAWNGDLLAPAYEAELSPPAQTNEFVCGLAP